MTIQGTAPVVRAGDCWSWAEFSPCGKYRYALGRRWQTGDRLLVWVLLNPSTADEAVNDRTVRRCLGYARNWNFDSLVILNLFAFRAKDPAVMKATSDPVGPWNRSAFKKYITRDQTVVCAWGNGGQHRGQDVNAKAWMRTAGGRLFHLRMTLGGHPAHVARLPNGLPLQVWDW